eukprot:scaffold46163_cov46-Prasinocladus_malaysianus.AAC.1
MMHTYTGHTGTYLVTFPDNSESFLEAVQLDLLLNNPVKAAAQQSKVPGLELRGCLACGEVPLGFKSIKKLEVVGFCQRVLASFRSQKLMLAETQHIAADAEQQLMQHKHALADTYKYVDQLNAEANTFKDKFEEQCELVGQNSA